MPSSLATLAPWRASLLAIVLVGCTPGNVSEAEKKHDIAYLAQSASPEAMSALGRLADQDQAARDALERLGNETVGDKTLDGGASALDVYLAAWGAVERNQDWGSAMIKRGLSQKERMNGAASAIKRGSPQLPTFLPELDSALLGGCDVRCGSAIASASGPAVMKLVAARLADDRTREAMCDGLGSQDASREARGVFAQVPEKSRDALGCPGAAARIAARDDDVLAWLAKTAEPGLLKSTGTSDAIPCDRLAKLWAMALAAREHAQYSALAIPLGGGVKRCAKTLDGMLAAGLASDVDTQTLMVAAIDPLDSSLADLKLSCGALPHVAHSAAGVPAKGRAQDALTHCK